MNYSDIKHKFNTVNGFMGSEAQREFMFNLAKMTNCAAEIGSYKGLSACIVLAGMSDTNRALPPRYYCIDTFEASNTELESESTLEEFTNAVKEFDPRSLHYKILKGFSGDPHVLDQIKDETLEFLYIDGSHETEDVLNDVILYHSKIVRGGLYLFHDFTWDTVRAAVDSAAIGGILEPICRMDDFGVYRKK
jgi:predicted O-methyltransferase YrrM